MTNDNSASCIGAALAALIVGALLLILYGFGHAYSECQDRGGEYVRKLNGLYTCVDEDR